MIRFNFNNHRIVSTIYPTERCNVTMNFCIMEMATVVWKTNVAQVRDLKQRKEVLADKREYLDDY